MHSGRRTARRCWTIRRAGTTSLVSMQEGRRSIICELNPEYATLARGRIDAAWMDGAAQMDVFRDYPAA